MSVPWILLYYLGHAALQIVSCVLRFAGILIYRRMRGPRIITPFVQIETLSGQTQEACRLLSMSHNQFKSDATDLSHHHGPVKI